MQDKKTRIAIEYMKELHRQSTFFDKILETLTAFSESEQQKHPEWRKGQALSVCTAIAFPFIEATLAKTGADAFMTMRKFRITLRNSRIAFFTGRSCITATRSSFSSTTGTTSARRICRKSRQYSAWKKAVMCGAETTRT